MIQILCALALLAGANAPTAGDACDKTDVPKIRLMKSITYHGQRADGTAHNVYGLVLDVAHSPEVPMWGVLLRKNSELPELLDSRPLGSSTNVTLPDDLANEDTIYLCEEVSPRLASPHYVLLREGDLFTAVPVDPAASLTGFPIRVPGPVDALPEVDKRERR